MAVLLLMLQLVGLNSFIFPLIFSSTLITVDLNIMLRLVVPGFWFYVPGYSSRIICKAAFNSDAGL
jgi:hypothetical protein